MKASRQVTGGALSVFDTQIDAGPITEIGERCGIRVVPESGSDAGT
jgi:hypothetical protein